MEKKNLGEQFKSLSGDTKEYLQLKLELFKLTATEKLAMVVSHLIISVIILFLVGMVVIFLSFAFIYWFDAHVGSLWAGALIVAGFDILVGVLIYAFRNPLFINPLVSKMSNIILEDDDDEES